MNVLTLENADCENQILLKFLSKSEFSLKRHKEIL